MPSKSMKDMFKLSFLEEVGNAVSHGVMGILILFILPFVSVYGYTKFGIIGTVAYGVYLICLFMMFMGSCIYHSMEFGSNQKYVFRKLDHCFIYLAIAGSYTPVLLLVMDGYLSLVFLIIEWIACIGGILLTSISKNYHKLLSMIIYMTMGWIAILIIPEIYHHSLNLLISLIVGGVFYSIGAVFYSFKKASSHFIWHIFIILASISHFIGFVFFI